MFSKDSAEEPSELEPSLQPDFHGSWAFRHTLDNGDLFHHFWVEWEAEQGWEGCRTPGTQAPSHADHLM